MTNQHHFQRSSLVIRAAAFVIAILTYGTADAQYVATGPYKGTVCSGFIIESCATHEIAAVKGKDGKLYALKTEHQSVDQHSEAKKRCHIRTKSSGAGLLSVGVNAVIQPVFLAKQSNGEYKELDIEYLSFPCIKK